jgi:hypothetical protein
MSDEFFSVDLRVCLSVDPRVCYYFLPEAAVYFKCNGSPEVITLIVSILCPLGSRIYMEDHREKGTERHGGEKGL